MSSEIIITQESLGLMSPSEIELVHLLRTKYRWGMVTIEVANGLPVFLEQTVVRDKLGRK